MPPRIVRSWAIQKLELAFGAYLVWQAIAVAFSGRSGVNSPSFHYLIELSQVTTVRPELLLISLFLIPGVLTLIPRTRTKGLLVAAMCMLVHAVGTVRSVTLFENGAVTAPNTYLFIAFLAGWLYMTERNAE